MSNTESVSVTQAKQKPFALLIAFALGAALVSKESWTAFSMANDWATIYGEDVVKTGLPGLAEAA